MSNNHKTCLAALHTSKSPRPREIGEPLEAIMCIAVGDIVVGARRIRHETGSRSTSAQMNAMMADEEGITVDELQARAAALLEGIDQ